MRWFAAIRDTIARLVILAAIAAAGFALVYAAALIPGINVFAAAIALCLVLVYSTIRSRRRRRGQARLSAVSDAAADVPKPEESSGMWSEEPPWSG